MASQVLSGPGNPTYTNNTGQNVRVIINYMVSTATQVGPASFNERTTTTNRIVLNWAGVSASASSSVTVSTNIVFSGRIESGTAGPIVIGKSLATFVAPGAGTVVSNGAFSPNPAVALPLELLLAPGQTFSAVCGVYNIAIIPENG